MSDCEICRPDSLPAPSPGFTPVRLGGTRHRAGCPTLPRLSPEDEEQLRADLAELAAARRRAYAMSRDIVIG